MEGDFSNHFGTVAILGVGLIGGSIGLALRQDDLAHRVIGIGRDQSRLDQALRCGAIDVATVDLRAGVSEADLVIVCSTVNHIIQSLPDILAAVPAGCTVTDVGSTKAAITRSAHGDPRFTGGHPMAGSEKSGVEAATAALFHDATWAVTPSDSSSEHSRHTVLSLAHVLGAETLLCSPTDHDMMVGITSHLPHAMAAALMRLADHRRSTHPELRRLAAGSFGDATRVAASPAPIWRDVCLTNKESVLAAIQGLKNELDMLTSAVVSEDPKLIEAFFAGSNEASKSWRSS